MPHQQNQQLCKQSNEKLGRLIQYIIYFFNNNKIRSDIINSAIKEYHLMINNNIKKNLKKKEIFYMGTISFSGENIKDMKLCSPYDDINLNNYFRTSRSTYFKDKNVCDLINENKVNISEKPVTVFTCCYHYGTANVHFIAIIYIAKSKELLVFDSGVGVYPEGETHMLPLIKEAFTQAKLLKNTAELGKACYQHRYIAKDEPPGIQFAGDDKLRDAFCQTWSIWFLVNFLKKKKVIRKVCKLHPSNREIFLIKDFIVPILESHPTWIKKILKDHSEDLSSILFPETVTNPKEFLKALQDYSEGCRTKICQKGKSTVSTVCLMNRVK